MTSTGCRPRIPSRPLVCIPASFPGATPDLPDPRATSSPQRSFAFLNITPQEKDRQAASAALATLWLTQPSEGARKKMQFTQKGCPSQWPRTFRLPPSCSQLKFPKKAAPSTAGLGSFPHEAQSLMATATAAGLGIPGPDPGEWEEGGQSPQGPPFWRTLLPAPPRTSAAQDSLVHFNVL